MELLILTTPGQHDFNDPTVERNKDKLANWLSNLPLLNAGESIRIVINALDACNEQRMQPADRMKLLEVYRSTVKRLFDTVDPLHMRQLAWSKSQREQSVEGIENLLTSLASGYKIVVKELYRSRSGKRDETVFSLALIRSLELLSYALLDSFRFYRPVPAYVYLEINQLYRLARHLGLHNKVIIQEQDEVEEQISLATRYQAIQLLSVSDAFRLAEGEAGLLFEVLRQHAHLCRIVPGDQCDEDSEGQFVIDLCGDSPPQRCGLEQGMSGVEEPYIIDARLALKSIRKGLVDTPSGVRAQSPEAILLRHLLPEAPAVARAREERRPDGSWAKLVLGIDPIHAWLSRSRGPDSSGKWTEPSSCHILDVSDNGYRISWEEGSPGDARVGELLCLVDGGSGESGQIKLTLIRSVRIHRNAGMELGLQLIRGTPAAVYCRTGGGADESADCCFFLQGVVEEQLQATLIAPKGIFETSRSLIIDVGNKEVRVRAGRLVYESPVFDRFEFIGDTAGET